MRKVRFRVIIGLQIAFLAGVFVFGAGTAYQNVDMHSPTTSLDAARVAFQADSLEKARLQGEVKLAAAAIAAGEAVKSDLEPADILAKLAEGAFLVEADTTAGKTAFVVASKPLETVPAGLVLQPGISAEIGGNVQIYRVDDKSFIDGLVAASGEERKTSSAGVSLADLPIITDDTGIMGMRMNETSEDARFVSEALEIFTQNVGRHGYERAIEMLVSSAGSRPDTIVGLVNISEAEGARADMLIARMESLQADTPFLTVPILLQEEGRRSASAETVLLQSPQVEALIEKLSIATVAGESAPPATTGEIAFVAAGREISLETARILREAILGIPELSSAAPAGTIALAGPRASSAGTYSGVLFDTGNAISSREGVEFTAVDKARRTAQQVIELIRGAKTPLTITAHLRGMDLAGSSLDLPEFQYSLTDQGVTKIEDIPSTPTLASEFIVTIRFEAADNPNVIEYIAPDYNINEPYVVTGEVVLEDGKVPDGQKGAPAYIFRNKFGLRGIRIICESISPMAQAGGMESSNAFNVALYAAASMLSGENWSLADIFADAVKIENEELAGLTGGQGHLSSILGGAYHHIWQSGIRGADGNRINPYSAFSTSFIDPEDFSDIEEYMVLAQAGVEYEKGKPSVGRAASFTNNMWTDLLREKDAKGTALHREKLGLTVRYIQAIRDKDMETAVEVINRYVDIRDELCVRWMECVLKEGKVAWLNRLEAGDREVAATYGFDKLEKAAILPQIRTGKTYHDERLNELALENLQVLYDGKISIYSDSAKDFTAAARKAGIAVMALGAGGPGAIYGVVSPKGQAHLKEFFASQDMPLLTDEGVREVVHGTGTLKGYIPFKIGREPIQFRGFKELGLQEPALPTPATYTEATAKFTTPDKASSAGVALVQLGPAQIILSNIAGAELGKADTATSWGLEELQKIEALKLAGGLLAEMPESAVAARAQMKQLIEELQAPPVAPGEITTAAQEREFVQPKAAAGLERVLVPVSAQKVVAIEQPVGTYQPVMAETEVPAALAGVVKAERGGMLIDYNTLGIRITRKDGSEVCVPNDYAMKAIAILNTLKAEVTATGVSRYHVAVFSNSMSAAEMQNTLGALAVPFDSFVNAPTVVGAIEQIRADQPDIAKERFTVTLAQSTIENTPGVLNGFTKLAEAVKMVMVKTPQPGQYVSYKAILLNSLKLLEGVIPAGEIKDLQGTIEDASDIRGLTVDPEDDTDKAIARMQAAISV